MAMQSKRMPMQLPANMPVLEMRHELEMKHASTVL
jgi:hypothetical protein